MLLVKSLAYGLSKGFVTVSTFYILILQLVSSAFEAPARLCQIYMGQPVPSVGVFLSKECGILLSGVAHS